MCIALGLESNSLGEDAFLECLNEALERILPRDSVVPLGNLNSYVNHHGETWNGVDRRNGLPHLNLNLGISLRGGKSILSNS